MAYGPRNIGPGRDGPPGQRAPSGVASGGPGLRASGSNGGSRTREIEEALRPPAQPPGYFAPNSGAVRAELLDDEAQRTARELAPIPASQLRRFYTEVMALKRRLELATTGIPDDEVQAQMALLKAKAAYTCRRQDRYPIELVKFFTRHAAAVKGKHDFQRGFQPHFEAVMAYHRVFEKDKKGSGEA